MPRNNLWWTVRVALMLNVLLALSASSVAMAAALLVGARPSLAGACASFALVFAVYNFDRLADNAPAEGRSTEQRARLVERSRRVLLPAIVACLVSALTLGLGHGLRATIWTVAFPMFGMAYVALPLPFRDIRRIKDIPYFKCFYAPSCWTLFVGLGAAYAGLAIDATISWFAVFFGLRMFASGYLGDIRDLNDDAAAGTRTIAGVLGVDRSHRLLRGIHVLSGIWVALGLWTGALPAGAWPLLPLILIGAGFQAAYERWPARHGIIFELYDLETVLYAPCLWWALS